jgi:hypothetical protein
MKPYRTILHVAALVLLVACSQQGEGERCVAANRDGDCASDLICVEAVQLEEYYTAKDTKYVADRCCPTTDTSSDPRCKRKPEVGASAAGGATGTASTDTAAAGTSSSVETQSGTGGNSSGNSQAAAGASGSGAAGTAGITGSGA